MQYAHLGGVPEALGIVVPAVLLVLILRAGRKRAGDEDEADEIPGEDDAAG